jgi:uncharacterized membrane protein HdeD (DUF308 family)
MLSVLARNWWALALRGLFAVLFGLITLLWPGLTLIVLVIVFGAYVLVDGIFAIIAAVRAAETRQRWVTLALEGVAGIVAGILTFLWPNITALVLLYLIAIWAIVTGVLEIGVGAHLRHHVAGEWALILGGIVSLLFGVLLILFPGAGALAVVWLIGIYALVFGLLMLVLAVRLRALARHLAPA